MFLPWKKWKPETWILCFLLSSSPPKLFLKKAVLKFRKIPLETLAVDFCFSCITQTFISTYWIELYSMLSLEFWGSNFSKYLRLIAATKNSYQTCPRKNLLLKFSQYLQENTFVGVSFYWPSGLQFYKKETSIQVFSREYHEIFKKTYFENICEWLFLCISPVLSNIIFQIHKESLLHVQPSLLRNIFCVISVDNKIQRGLQLQNAIQFTCTENIENRVKKFENLKKKLRGVNTCCF